MNKENDKLKFIRHFKGTVEMFKDFFDEKANANTNAYDSPVRQGYGIHPTRDNNQFNVNEDFVDETNTLTAVYQGPLKKYREKLYKVKKEQNGSYTVFLNDEGKKIVEVRPIDLRFVEDRSNVFNYW